MRGLLTWSSQRLRQRTRLGSRLGLALAAIAGLGGCATEINGPVKLVGEKLDAATALYGPWNEQFTTPQGRTDFIWRRRLKASNGDFYCELHVELGFHDTIGQAYTVGIPEACKLFLVRLVPSTK